MSRKTALPPVDLWARDQDWIREQGILRLCGIDEAGRGPLAGPVCAAAVVLDPARPIQGLGDSKKLTEKKRELLYGQIREKALGYGIGWASPQEIDEYNILQATFLAMKRALGQLAQQGLRPDWIIVDGNRDPGFDGQAHTQTAVGGDGAYACVAAASILAKVSRDRHMLELDAGYPQYGFAKHKGYPTALHYQMLGEYGISPVHRRSFLENLEQHLEKLKERQK